MNSQPTPETPDVDQEAPALAKEDGVSLNKWIAIAVAQKVGAVETPAEFFKHRAAGHSLDEFDDILDRVPDRLPEPGDELPEGWTPASRDGR